MTELTPMKKELRVLNDRAEMLRNRIGASWYDVLKEEFDKEYMLELQEGLKNARLRKTIYPPPDKVFRAFKLTPFKTVKTVWVAQDPYNDGKATGLAFESIRTSTAVDNRSPSLKKIAEIYDKDCPGNFNTNVMDGSLEDWAVQGVLLINLALTVPRSDPGRHLAKWEPFTKRVLEALIFDSKPKVFVFIGSYAMKYSSWIVSPHLALTYEHPAYAARQNRPWNAEGVFTKVNAFLIDNEIHPIEW